MGGRHGRALLALLALLALVAGACGGDGGKAERVQTATTATTVRMPTFAPGSTMARLQEKGKIVVGTKFDQPGFGQKDPATNQVEGFDVEIAKLMAVGIFGGDLESVKSKIEFVEAISKNREPFIQQGKVDMVVATYTISDARKQVVDFAGPYFIARQDIMVKSDDNSIKNVDDLNGKKVCTVRGSTSETNVKAKAPRANLTLFDTYSLCAEALKDGRVNAVTTDNTILAGLVQASGGDLKLLDAPFSDEPYGIGLRKGTNDFRDFLNRRLEETFNDGSWGEAFRSTLGRLGLETPTPPALDRYVTVTSSTTSTTSGSRGTTTTRTAATSTSTTAGGGGSVTTGGASSPVTQY